MAKIRVYVCNWEKVGNRIANPINKLFDPNQKVPGLEWISYHYAEAKTDGTPNNPVCIAFVKAEDFTVFDSVADTVKLPIGNLSNALSVQEKNNVVNTLSTQFKISKKIFNEAGNRKEILFALAKYIHPQFKSMGNIKDEDFE